MPVICNQDVPLQVAEVAYKTPAAESGEIIDLEDSPRWNDAHRGSIGCLRAQVNRLQEYIRARAVV